MEGIMLMGPTTMWSENRGGNQVSYLVCIACRFLNLMLSQSSYCIFLNKSRVRISEPLLSRERGDPAAAMATAQPTLLHDEGWRKFPVIHGAGLAAA